MKMEDCEELKELLMILSLRKQRIIKDRSNPMEDYDDNKFRHRFRFYKTTIHNSSFRKPGPAVPGYLKNQVFQSAPCSETASKLSKMKSKNHKTIFHFFVNCSRLSFSVPEPELVCGDLHGMHQTTVSRIVLKVSSVISNHIINYIKFPADINEVKRRLFQMAKFPGVVGTVDGTHIPLKNPSRETDDVFRNRKGYHSLNVQVVGGPDNEIFDIVCRWPGSAHDSRIFRDSSINLRFEEGELQGIILGDSGYPQSSYLFTPILNESRLADERYNLAHKITRTSIERIFGIWKRRFLCLNNKMATKLQTTRRIIIATAILHNIAMRCNDRDEGFPPCNDNQPDNVLYSGPQRSTNILKHNFITRYFRRG